MYSGELAIAEKKAGKREARRARRGRSIKVESLNAENDGIGVAPMPEPCPICGNPSNAGSPTFRGRKEVTCETCGQFQISDNGEAALKRLSPRIDAPN